jgi:hypothetical protein
MESLLIGNKVLYFQIESLGWAGKSSNCLHPDGYWPTGSTKRSEFEDYERMALSFRIDRPDI